MIDLKPWKCTCGAEFVDTHAAITVEIPAHTRGTDHAYPVLTQGARKP